MAASLVQRQLPFLFLRRAQIGAHLAGACSAGADLACFISGGSSGAVSASPPSARDFPGTSPPDRHKWGRSFGSSPLCSTQISSRDMLRSSYPESRLGPFPCQVGDPSTRRTVLHQTKSQERKSGSTQGYCFTRNIPAPVCSSPTLARAALCVNEVGPRVSERRHLVTLARAQVPALLQQLRRHPSAPGASQQTRGVQVEVQGGNIERAIKKFKMKLRDDNSLRMAFARRRFWKGCELKRLRAKESLIRRRNKDFREKLAVIMLEKKKGL